MNVHALRPSDQTRAMGAVAIGLLAVSVATIALSPLVVCTPLCEPCSVSGNSPALAVALRHSRRSWLRCSRFGRFATLCPPSGRRTKARARRRAPRMASYGRRAGVTEV